MTPETLATRPLPMPRDALRPLRYLWRTPALLLHLVVGLPIALVCMNPLTAHFTLRGGERLDHRAIRAWSTVMLRIFGFRLRRFGTPLPGAAMFVANHVSWLDILLLHSQRAVGFVAKAEISRWPLIGWMAARAGTIYHHRGNNESLHGVMHQMVDRLRSGHAVGVFPEGRTTDGLAIAVFHARIFQPAVVAEVPVQPVALRYGVGGASQTEVAFARDENFLANFLRLLGDRPRVAEVHFLQPVAVSEDGRRRLADSCRAQIMAAMSS
jgi:1-acyl-sn-glycerol-3-phosphate acyltransferase